jgi:putative ABC transport system ATP-binding protein
MTGCDVRLVDVSKTFTSRGSVGAVALRNISIAIGAGEFVVVVGANGSGKTTMLRLLAGELEPTTGSVELNASAGRARQPRARAALVARVHQNPDAGVIGDLTVLDNLRLSAIHSRFAAPWRLGPSAADLRRFVGEIQPRLSVALHARVSDLSQGQRQMLAMEMALLRQPLLLLLDEHTASLDRANALECLRLTERLSRATGVTVVMVTHNFADASIYGDRLIALRDGELAANVSGDAKRTLTAIDVFDLCGFRNLEARR